MLKPVPINLDKIYVPVKYKDAVDRQKVEELTQSILEKGLLTPIHVRADKDRYVLVTGLHRLEAVRALGETQISALIVRARQF